MKMDQIEIEKEILELVKDNKISCKEVMELAYKAGTPTQKMASLLDKHHIKIIHCQLGCF
ncbi:MAG: hypothetical protein V1930_06840 [Pseudomonadota bacterium]